MILGQRHQLNHADLGSDIGLQAMDEIPFQNLFEKGAITSSNSRLYSWAGSFDRELRIIHTRCLLGWTETVQHRDFSSGHFGMVRRPSSH